MLNKKTIKEGDLIISEATDIIRLIVKIHYHRYDYLLADVKEIDSNTPVGKFTYIYYNRHTKI